MPKCTVCNHPQHPEINQAILSGDFTLAVLSQKYGLGSSSLQRHKNHIEVNMSRAYRRLREIREQGGILMLNDILENVRRNIAAADSEGNYNAVFRGSYIASRLIHQMGRIEGDMQPDTLHRLISSAGWVPQASLLPTDPGLITGLHQGLLDGAFGPCPEPPPDISADAIGAADDQDLVDSFLETGNSELETGLATLRQLQKLLPDLDLTLDDISPEAEPETKNQREISEKLAKNIPPDTENYQQYQEYEPSEKNLPKNPACAPNTIAPPTVLAMTDELPAPSPETANRKPATLFSPPPADPQVVDLSQEVSVGRENEVHHAVSATDESQEVLDEALAAELAAYLKGFPPYAKGARDPNPDPPSAPKIHVPETENRKPETVLSPPPGSGPSRPPNFGNPGLFQSMKGNFM